MYNQHPFLFNSHSVVGLQGIHAPMVADNLEYSQDILGIQALWRAVITQALMDASSNSSKVIDKVERARARAWFSKSNPDFLTVCAYADLDPSYVLQKAKEAIKRGCKWRSNNVPKKTVQSKKPVSPYSPPTLKKTAV